ncbi:nicotinate-nucleotide adenylyltransferase [Alkaliphilus pronyensis]|uniref:Probable nicotinate-nucleotide adenylyltransferase n=1 Tax=Alkaliphilus pronyensis TaxID=1482732 RepID=A0A6I0FDU3_9FIRM|nr:nicotinate-nucleotide adenylyltransferase [Alkaliphilus pronyensis]KAB3537239.1 nicotinate-nucleotide adenylyltransferase [Alkaliphilus pronyensis]
MDNEKKNRKGIGILGGTFDPIHLGHLYIAEAAMDELALEKVIFIPTCISPHKLQANITEVSHRLIMTNIATNANKRFLVSDIEIKRRGISFTIETINELKKIYNDNNKLHLILGGDSFIGLEEWKSYKTLLETTNLVVVSRAGNKDVEIKEKINHYKSLYNTKIILLTIPTLEISATSIRQRVNEGKTIKYLVPEGVETYIAKNKLYGYKSNG